MQRLENIERRLEALEGSPNGSRVRGWEAAARVLGVTSATIKRWWKTDPRFPRPIGLRTFGPITQGNDRRVSPEWSVDQLRGYK